MANTLDIPLPELRAALKRFRELEVEADSVRKAVDENVRGIGSHWYGKARTSYDAEIDHWLTDYNNMVAKPMTQMLNWLQTVITNMQNVEDANS